MIKPTSASTSPLTKQAIGKTAGADDTRAADDERKAGGYTADADHAGEPVERFTRERDDERPTREFDTDLGEWVQPRRNTSPKRALAAAQVKKALSCAQVSRQLPDTPQN